MDSLLEDFQELGNTKPIRHAFKCALRSPGIEVFGLFIFTHNKCDYEFIELPNLNKINPNYFISNNKTVLKYILSKSIISLFHSHVIDSPELSDLDKRVSTGLGLPSFVFSTKSKSSFLYYPESYSHPPLENRIFIPFFQDCVSFVRDFYFTNLNINLIPQISNWARDPKKSDINLLKIIENLFFEVNINEVKYGDLIVFKKDLFFDYHLGVIDRDGKYSHHPTGFLPRTELFTDSVINKVYKVYRYKV